MSSQYDELFSQLVLKESLAEVADRIEGDLEDRRKVLQEQIDAINAALKAGTATEKPLKRCQDDIQKLDDKTKKDAAKADEKTKRDLAKVDGKVKKDLAKLDDKLQKDLEKCDDKHQRDIEQLESKVQDLAPMVEEQGKQLEELSNTTKDLAEVVSENRNMLLPMIEAVKDEKNKMVKVVCTRLEDHGQQIDDIRKSMHDMTLDDEMKEKLKQLVLDEVAKQKEVIEREVLEAVKTQQQTLQDKIDQLEEALAKQKEATSRECDRLRTETTLRDDHLQEQITANADTASAVTSNTQQIVDTLQDKVDDRTATVDDVEKLRDEMQTMRDAQEIIKEEVKADESDALEEVMDKLKETDTAMQDAQKALEETEKNLEEKLDAMNKDVEQLQDAQAANQADLEQLHNDIEKQGEAVVAMEDAGAQREADLQELADQQNQLADAEAQREADLQELADQQNQLADAAAQREADLQELVAQRGEGPSQDEVNAQTQAVDDLRQQIQALKGSPENDVSITQLQSAIDGLVEFVERVDASSIERDEGLKADVEGAKTDVQGSQTDELWNSCTGELVAFVNDMSEKLEDTCEDTITRAEFAQWIALQNGDLEGHDMLLALESWLETKDQELNGGKASSPKSRPSKTTSRFAKKTEDAGDDKKFKNMPAKPKSKSGRPARFTPTRAGSSLRKSALAPTSSVPRTATPRGRDGRNGRDGRDGQDARLEAVEAKCRATAAKQSKLDSEVPLLRNSLEATQLDVEKLKKTVAGLKIASDRGTLQASSPDKTTTPLPSRTKSAYSLNTVQMDSTSFGSPHGKVPNKYAYKAPASTSSARTPPRTASAADSKPPGWDPTRQKIWQRMDSGNAEWKANQAALLSARAHRPLSQRSTSAMTPR